MPIPTKAAYTLDRLSLSPSPNSTSLQPFESHFTLATDTTISPFISLSSLTSTLQKKKGGKKKIPLEPLT